MAPSLSALLLFTVPVYSESLRNVSGARAHVEMLTLTRDMETQKAWESVLQMTLRKAAPCLLLLLLLFVHTKGPNIPSHIQLRRG